MKNISLKGKRWKYDMVAMILGILFMVPTFSAYAQENTVYTIGRSTSYVHPDTGVPVDGGDNIALGDSMCESIVEDQILVEETQGKKYMTIGIGLISNISDIQIQMVGSDGQLRNVDFELTGTCERMGDQCNHYRFEVLPEDQYISPILFVDPMGREVQFFITPDESMRTEGTGSFTATLSVENTETEVEEMEAVTEDAEKITKEEPSEIEKEQEKEIPEKKEQENKTENTEKSKEENSENHNKMIYVLAGIVVVCICGGWILIKKRK